MQNNDEGLIKTKDAAKLIPISVSHFNQKLKHVKGFPKPYLLTPMSKALWHRDEIVEWRNNRRAA